MDTKKAYHHGNLREALLEAAIELIDSEGIGALTIRKLADTVGVSHAAPAYHFPDKGALLVAVATEGFRRLGNYFVECINEPDVSERIRKLGHAYISFALAHPSHYRVMFGSDIANMKIDDSGFIEAASGSFRFLHETMKEIYPESSKEGMDAMTAALSAWSSVHGLVMLWVDGTLKCQFHNWTDDYYQTMSRAVIDNLTTLYRGTKQTAST